MTGNRREIEQKIGEADSRSANDKVEDLLHEYGIHHSATISRAGARDLLIKSVLRGDIPRDAIEC